MLMHVEVLPDGDKLSQNFTQDVLREVRALSVYSQIEKLRRSAKNQESQDLLRQIKTVLAAQISLKYKAQSFKEKMEYDRIVASISRLVAQLCDEEKYNNEHRMYAYYALRKRCNEIIKSYAEHSRNERTAMDGETVDYHGYSIKYLASGLKRNSCAALEKCVTDSVVEIDLGDVEKKNSLSKVTFGIRKFIKDNFDVPAFTISLKEIRARDLSQTERSKLFKELSLSMMGAFSKVKGIIFQPMSVEEVSQDLDFEIKTNKNRCAKPKAKPLSAKSRSSGAVKAKSADKIQSAKKKKSSKK